MSLDALAPDQRAVVQLVLQQDRSYDELAGLLGISAETVRDRARRGLDRLAPAGGVGDDERGDIADYLLGQQSVSGRERTRSLLAGSAPARAWAGAVAAQLRDVARTPLPEVPGGEPEPPATPIGDAARGGEGVAEPGRRGGEEPVRRERPSRRSAEEAPGGEPSTEPAVRARPRPRPDRARPATGRTEPGDARRAAAAAAPATAVDQPAEGGAMPDRGGPASSGVGAGSPARSSRLGGAILLAGLAILLVAGVIWLINRDDDGGGTTAGSDPTPTATATSTAESGFRALGRVLLEAPGGGDAQGEMIIFASESDGGLAFTLQGTDVPPTARGEAYAVWLTGGDDNHRLGFAPQVGEDGQLGTSGPREADRQRFASWFTDARRVVVSRETEEGTTAPGPVVLQGRIRREAGSG